MQSSQNTESGVLVIERRTRVGDYVMFSQEAGSPGNPEVVLVHGFLVSSRYMTPTLRALAPTCRVLAPDLPGWGRSEKPPHGGTLSLFAMAETLVEWTECMGLARPIFVGNSFGCQIITELAVRHPDRISAAVLLGPTVDRHARFVLHQAYRLALDVPRERPGLWAVELRDLGDKGIPRTIRELRVMMDDHIEEKLPRMSAPTLVVRGDRDPIATDEWAREVRSLLPRGSLLTLPDAPHAANYSTPTQFATAILPFIREHWRRVPLQP